MKADPRRLERAIGYHFARAELLEQALTHRSAGAVHNERLEFLGDALIGFLIAEALWERFPGADEGTLSRLRASLVKREALAELARELGLGDYLFLGPGEVRTGGHARDSILANAFEAVLGALYLDAGFDQSKTRVLALFARRLAQTTLEGSIKDPKTRLQEWLQGRRRPLPDYLVEAVGGNQHDQIFVVSCNLTDADLVTRAEGGTRRGAEQEAAQQMLGLIQDD